MAKGKKKTAFDVICEAQNMILELGVETLTEQEFDSALIKMNEIIKKFKVAKKDAAFNTEKIALEEQMKELYKKYGKKQ